MWEIGVCPCCPHCPCLGEPVWTAIFKFSIFNLPPYQHFLVLREETSSYRLLAGTFHAFAGMIFLIIRTVAVEIIDRLYVVYRPMGILLPVVAGIRLCITQTTLFVITSRRWSSASLRSGSFIGMWWWYQLDAILLLMGDSSWMVSVSFLLWCSRFSVFRYREKRHKEL